MRNGGTVAVAFFVGQKKKRRRTNTSVDFSEHDHETRSKSDGMEDEYCTQIRTNNGASRCGTVAVGVSAPASAPFVILWDKKSLENLPVLGVRVAGG